MIRFTCMWAGELCFWLQWRLFSCWSGNGDPGIKKQHNLSHLTPALPCLPLSRLFPLLCLRHLSAHPLIMLTPRRRMKNRDP
jgi:hypothetical protein